MNWGQWIEGRLIKGGLVWLEYCGQFHAVSELHTRGGLPDVDRLDGVTTACGLRLDFAYVSSYTWIANVECQKCTEYRDRKLAPK